MVHIDDLLRQAEVRQSDDLAEEEDVALAELKEQAGLDTAGEKDVADERPVLDWNILLLVLKQIRQFRSATLRLKSSEMFVTCSTGLLTRYFSRKALGDMSYMMLVARCCRMVSMVWRGCCLVILRYFCRGRAIEGNMDWAAS